MGKLIPAAEKAHIKVSPLEIMPVLMYEVGDLAKCAKYAEACPSYESLYHAEMRLALCDAITQLRLLAEYMGWDIDEIVVDGEERFIERMAERKAWQEER